MERKKIFKKPITVSPYFIKAAIKNPLLEVTEVPAMDTFPYITYTVRFKDNNPNIALHVIDDGPI